MDDIGKWAEFLKSINEIKPYIIILFSILAAGFGFLQWSKIKSARHDALIKEQALNNLTSTVSDCVIQIGSTTNMVLALRELLDAVRNCLDGKINKANSLRVIHAKFESVQMRLQYVVERSLQSNGYNGQEQYIADKLRTEMGDVLSEARQQLERLDLSVDCSYIFSLKNQDGTERYILCDEVWEAVQSLFSQEEQDIRNRIEHARLKIRNVVADYVSKRLQKVVMTDSKSAENVQSTAFFRNRRVHASKIYESGVQ